MSKKDAKQMLTLRKILKRIKKYWFLLTLSVLSAAASVALTLYAPLLIGDAVDYIIGEGNVDFRGVFGTLLVLCVVIGLTAVFQWLMNICNNRVAYRTTCDIRDEAFRKISILPLKYIDGRSTGEVSLPPEYYCCPHPTR